MYTTSYDTADLCKSYEAKCLQPNDGNFKEISQY